MGFLPPTYVGNYFFTVNDIVVLQPAYISKACHVTSGEAGLTPDYSHQAHAMELLRYGEFTSYLAQ